MVHLPDYAPDRPQYIDRPPGRVSTWATHLNLQARNACKPAQNVQEPDVHP